MSHLQKKTINFGGAAFYSTPIPLPSSAPTYVQHYSNTGASNVEG